MIIKKFVIPFLTLAGLAFAIYAGTMNYPFLFDDDRLIREGNDLQKTSSLIDNFFVAGRAFEKKTNAGFYRPVLYDSYTLDCLRSGPVPGSFRLTNILIHILNSFLIYLLFMALFGQGRGAGASAFLASALFCLHPLQSEPVIFITARSVSLLTFFCLTSLLLYIRFKRTGSKTSLAASFLFYALGLFTKETAAPFSFVYLLYDYSEKKKRPKKYLYSTPFIGASVSFTLFRMWYLAFSSPINKSLGFMTHWLTEVTVIPRYLLLVVFPFGLSADHGVKDIETFSDPYFIAGLALTCIFFLILTYALRRRSPNAMLLLWPVLAMLPEMVFPLNDAMVEYRMYLPMAAISLLAAAMFRNLLERMGARRLGKVSIAGASLVLVIFGTASYERGKVWANPITLWTDANKKAPGFVRPYMGLGIALAEKREFAQAKAYFEKAATLDPDDEGAYISLGNVNAELGNKEKAIDMEETAIRMNSKSYMAYQNLAMIYLNYGDYEGAFNTFRRMANALPERHAIIQSGAQYLLDYGQVDLAAKLLQE